MRETRETRRFHALRRVTTDVLAKIRRLNRLAIAMRAGLMDTEEAAREIAAAEADLHDLVDRLRDVAGVEDEAPVDGDDERQAAPVPGDDDEDDVPSRRVPRARRARRS